MFKRKRFKASRLAGYTYKRPTHNGRKIWIRLIALIILTPIAGAGFWFYTTIIQQLPDISEIEDFNFKQATVITDRNGEELYKLFDENREYIEYERISEHFVNAIVATEDQRFWENPGIDRRGTLRAAITDIRYGKTHGGSTITQQLIKNVMLSPEKRIERKLKEIILAVKLNSFIKKDIKRRYAGLSEKDAETKVKEKVLELYANLIFLGNNSYGIETASNTYFGTSAQNLDILQAAILAGIPQAPSRYDPYNNRGSLMGSVNVTDTNGTPAEMTEGLKDAVFERINENLENANFTFRRDDSAVIQYFKGLLSFTITFGGQVYEVKYSPGRKDTVLARMYDEGYITELEFKNSFAEGLDYTFQRGRIEIKAPHFVFWVINQLEESYDQDILRKEGLTIKTTLDYSIQQMAEEAILENEEHLTAYEAGNAALLYLDSLNGDILAYVGSKNYYNEEIDGQVDIIQSLRQPGSSIKPFVYALGFMKLALTIDSPIYDVNISIGNNTPGNADGVFDGLLPIKNALAASRNIPAIKMFLAVGGETPLKGFLSSIGIESLRSDGEFYGYPLAIGAGEIKMLELAKAYSHLSAMGEPAQINPILEIRGPDGSLLTKKQIEKETQSIPAGVAYLLWSILSDKNNFPAGWVSNFSYPGISFGTKSGTTNVVKGTQKLPRDGRLAAYTPSKVMIHRAGNTDGSALRQDAFGGWLNSPVRKTFVEKLDTNGLIQNEVPPQKEVKSVTISRLSGKLVSDDTPLIFSKKTLSYLQTTPTEVDTSVTKVDVDTLCDGMPSELTPPSEIEQAYLISPETILPNQVDLGKISERRQNEGVQAMQEELDATILLEALTGSCSEREMIAELGEISLDILQPTDGQTVTREFSLRHQTTSPFKITSMKLLLGSVELKSFSYNRAGNLIDISTVKIPEEIDTGTYPLKAVVFDEKGFSDTQEIEITVVDNDTTPPELMEDKIKVTQKTADTFEVVMLFSDNASIISTGRIEKNGQIIHEFKGNVAVFEVAELGTINYSVIDSSGNKNGGNITLKASSANLPEDPEDNEQERDKEE